MLADDPIHLPEQAAKVVKSSTATLQKWRSEGGGPEFVKLGRRRVGYRESTL